MWKTVFSVIVVWSTVKCNQDVLRNSDKETSSFFYGILSEAANSRHENSTCLKEIKVILKGLDQKELWALKTIDASGTTQSNFVHGQIFWLGSEFACDNLNQPFEMSVSDDYFKELNYATAPFEMKYAIVYANYTSKFQYGQPTYLFIPIHIGLCLPKSCTNEQIFEFSQRYFSSDTLMFKDNYNLTMDVVEVKKTCFSEFIQHKDVLFIISTVLILVVLVILFNIVPVENISENNIFKRIMKCFNLKENYKNLMSTTTRPEAIVPLDSLRTIVCFLIMLQHMGYFSLIAAENSALVYISGYDYRLLILFLCGLYVDAFFVISAFLLCHNFMNNERQKKDIKENGVVRNVVLYLKLVVNRYLRLTPAFLFTLAAAHLAAVYIKYNLPIHVPENYDLYCELNSLWKSLLYIHGHFPVDSMCSPWTWYLSSDMQYFLVCLFGLFVYVKTPKGGQTFFVSLCIASLTYSYIKNSQEKFEFTQDILIEKRDSLYVNPLVRMNPVFPGIFAAYTFYKLKNSNMKLEKRHVFAWSSTTVAILISNLVGFKYLRYLPGFVAYTSNSIGRFVFGIICVLSIQFIHLGHGGSFGRFMRHRYFVHLSKLTYIMYLIYPVLAALYVANLEGAYNISISSIYISGIGLMVACYIFSVIVAIFFEVPYCRLSSEFIMKKGKDRVKVVPDTIVCD